MAKIVIGLTGSFGSGCTTIAQEFFLQKDYEYLSLSSILRKIFKEEFPDQPDPSRSQLQDYGNKIREDKGTNFLALQAITEITRHPEKDKWVIDSFRNLSEMNAFRQHFTSCYFIGVYADYDIRWERVKKKYEENERNFKTDDKRDSNEEENPAGQQVRDCFKNCDITLANNVNFDGENEDYILLQQKIFKFIALMENPFSDSPSSQEAIMAMAYANSLRSSCLKRRVGAVIIDEIGNLFSSGYNEVPRLDRSCKKKHNRCYRDKIKEEIKEEIRSVIDEPGIQKQLENKILKRHKNLDYCRALHAEENAILNVARLGSSLALKGATIYSTTYPCNLCAQKIVQVGISNLIYLEPYPMEEAKKILSDVKQQVFEGVTFIGYFKLYGGDKNEIVPKV